MGEGNEESGAGTGGSQAAIDGSRDFQRAIAPDAQKRAKALLLRRSDFPSGWRGTPPEDGADESDEELYECLGADFSAFTFIGEAESKKFSAGGPAQASSDAEVFASEEMAAAAVAESAETHTNEALSRCLAAAGRAGEFEDEEFAIGEIRVGDLSFTPPPGVDDALGWRMNATIEGKPGTRGAGLTVPMHMDVIQLREGDETASLTLINAPRPFDPKLRDKLLATIAGRLTK
jgi:hypothetical protein